MAAKHHITVAEIYEGNAVDLEKVRNSDSIILFKGTSHLNPSVHSVLETAISCPKPEFKLILSNYMYSMFIAKHQLGGSTVIHFQVIWLKKPNDLVKAAPLIFS